MSRSFAPFRLDPAAPDAGAQAAWDALRARSAVDSPFADLAYAAAAGRAFGLEPVALGVRGDDGRLAAGAVTYVRRAGPYRLGVIPPLTAHTPLLLADPLAEARVHAGSSPFGALMDALAPLAHVHALHLDPTTDDVRPALWRGWSARPLYTYRIPLAPREALEASWSASTRRTVRKQSAAFVVEETDDPAPIVALCAEAYERHGRRLPGGRAPVRALVEALRDAGRLRLLVAAPRDGSAPDAAVAVLHDGATAYYWLAGSHPGPAMTVLVGELLGRLHDAGFATFDFVGANTASIAEFKRKFGPELRAYYRLTLIRRPELRLLGRRFS